MPYFWSTNILLAKIESTYGVDPVPMDGSEVERNLETGYMGNQGSLPTELKMKLSYKVELVGSSAKGLAPEAGRLLKACGCAETVVALTSVTYNPISPPVLDSITHYLWIGDTLYKLLGGRGDCVMRWPAQKIPYLEFTFTSLFAVPAEAARVFPNNNTFMKPELPSSAKTPTFTINSVALILREASLAMNNQVEGRFLIGSESVQITDRQEVFSAQVEAMPVATLNPYALAQAATYVPVSLIHGTADGRRSTLNIPNLQMARALLHKSG